MAAKSYYEILGVSNDANEPTIRSAFRKAMREVHPDLNPSREKSQRRTRELNIAMEVLTDPVKRKRYDDKLLRMGKAKANAEFEQAATTNGSQKAETESATEPAAKSTEPTPPEVEFDFGGIASGRQSSSKRSQRKPAGFPSILGSLAILTAGLSAVCVSILGLWIFFRSDPTGLIAAEPQQITDTNAALNSDESVQLKIEVELLKSKLQQSETELAKTRTQVENASGPDHLVPREEELESLKSKLAESATELTKLRTLAQNELDPDLVGMFKNWLVDYRFAQALVVSNKWSVRYWDEIHSRLYPDFPAHAEVQMRPTIYLGGTLYSLDDLLVPEVPRWAGNFLGVMRPMSLDMQSPHSVPDIKAIRSEVEREFESKGIADTNSPKIEPTGSDDQLVAQLQKTLLEKDWVMFWMDTKDSIPIDFIPSNQETKTTSQSPYWEIQLPVFKRSMTFEFSGTTYVYVDNHNCWLGVNLSEARDTMRPMKLEQK